MNRNDFNHHVISSASFEGGSACYLSQYTHTHTQTFCCVYLTGPCSERLADVVCDFVLYLQFCFQYICSFEVLTAVMLQTCILRC